ncbi:hypothetical protein V8B55DRAFT_1460257 [Mucor lusitanicus]|uniref:F-box domain-containing protein n=2 Tax=Mucor circinelloides f. lusitanicus TaxID=29924 RepID=A0A162QX74_MUCCL|nr:hypothetical protein FB192DRAFT_1013555 [Mucor lusitanicus]OAD02469.1 hypothetical protein MUCCIDRAFT_164397 [Mucor lusitanicus CBS 277.49]
MKASIQQLPTEVIINIFDQINDAKQLIQCKLVSKSWTSLAEKSMYKTIHMYLWDDSRLERLNHHLKQKPEFCQLIQNILISQQYFYTFSKRLFQEFLSLAMTPSIRTLDGIWKQEYLTMLLDYVESSSLKFKKLKQLPYSVRHDSVYMQLMSHFKESLQTASCSITEKTTLIHQKIIRDSIKEYKYLTTLSIQDYRGFKSVQEIDTFLQKCDRIKNLEFIINQSTTYTYMDEDQLSQWLASGSVQQVDSVNYLKISYMKGPDHMERCSFGPDWINYLAYKYPNVERLSIENITLRYSHMAIPVFGNVKAFSLDDWRFHCTQDLQHFVDRVKSESNSVRYYKCIAVQGSEICSLRATKDRNNSLTKFEIVVGQEKLSNMDIVQSCFKNVNHTSNI